VAESCVIQVSLIQINKEIMPAPSKIVSLLTPDQRSELNRRLYEKDYGDFDSFVELLSNWGYEISRSSIGRYSQSEKRKVEAYQAAAARAAAIAAALPDDGAISDATTKIASLAIFDAIEGIDFSDTKSVANLAALAKAQAALSKAAIETSNFKRLYAEMIGKVDKALQDSATKGSISMETLIEVRRCYGLTDEEAREFQASLATERQILADKNNI
jgi:Protein of unknown function (DUF3486)